MSKNVERGAVESRAVALGAMPGEVDGQRLTPMLAERASGEEILVQAGWAYELKLDGVRILADVRGSNVRLLYRKSRDATASYPEVAEALAGWNAPRLLFDGEIVAFDELGRPSFERLGRRIPYHREPEVRAARRHTPVVYVVFDLLAVGDFDLRPLPLSSRREILRAAVPDDARDTVRVLEQLEGDGRLLFEFCRNERLEGVIAKRQDSPYRPGLRCPDWQKLKCETDDEFVVVGWTRGIDGGLGALDLGSYDGDTLVVRGEVGSGIDRRTAAALLERLRPMAVGAPSATETYERDPGRTHVRPELVVSVRYLAWSDSGRLRFPTFRGLRDEVEPTDCRAAPEAALPLRGSAPGPTRAATPPELDTYYRAVSEWLLPYLADRPILLTAPLQLEAPYPLPASLRTMQLAGKPAVIVEDLPGLLFLGQHGAIPLSVVASTTKAPDLADWLTFALDGAATELPNLVGVARELRDVLTALGLTPMVKTGDRGVLHVMTNVGGVPWDPLLAFARVITAILVERCAGRATGEPSARARRGRVFVDIAPNQPWTPLPTALAVGALGQVSVPLLWDEVSPDFDWGRWTMSTVPPRLRERGDPMRPLLDVRGDFSAAVSAVTAVAHHKG